MKRNVFFNVNHRLGNIQNIIHTAKSAPHDDLDFSGTETTMIIKSLSHRYQKIAESSDDRSLLARIITIAVKLNCKYSANTNKLLQLFTGLTGVRVDY